VLAWLVVVVFVGATYFHYQWQSSGTCWVESTVDARKKNGISLPMTNHTKTIRVMHKSNVRIAWRPIWKMFWCIMAMLTRNRPLVYFGVFLGWVALYYMYWQRGYVDALAEQSQHLCNDIIVAVKNTSVSS
jgi:hypothetical protein